LEIIIMQKNYKLKRGDLLVLETKSNPEDEVSIRKIEIVKDSKTKTTHGFEPLNVKEALFKTLEMKIVEALLGNKINFKKEIIKVKEIIRS